MTVGPTTKHDLVLGLAEDKNPVVGAVKGDHWVPGRSQGALDKYMHIYMGMPGPGTMYICT